MESLLSLSRMQGNLELRNWSAGLQLGAFANRHMLPAPGRRPALLGMHRDREAVQAGSSRRESAQASGIKYERTHVRCYRVKGEARRAWLLFVALAGRRVLGCCGSCGAESYSSPARTPG